MNRRIFELIDPSHTYDDGSRAFKIGMLVLIFLNVFVIETIDKVETAKVKVRISRTIADLAGAESIAPAHLAEAIQDRPRNIGVS